MEQFTRYGKAVAAGGAVLLCVLGAPSAAHASVPLFTETFSGTLDVTHNTIGTLGSFPHPNVTLEFFAQDLTHPGNTFTGNAFIGNLPFDPNNVTIPVPFEFTGTFDGVAGDTWAMDLEAISGLDGSSTGFPSTIFNNGNFTFVVPSSGPVTVGNSFSFTAGDPLVATGSVTSAASAGAPELDPTSTAAPLALVVSALLMLSNGRRRQDDPNPS